MSIIRIVYKISLLLFETINLFVLTLQNIRLLYRHITGIFGAVCREETHNQEILEIGPKTGIRCDQVQNNETPTQTTR